MKLKLNQENDKLAEEYGIPSLRKKRNQKRYYVLHLRNATRILQWLSIINVLLILALCYFFFTQKPETYYATAFSGKNTLLHAYDINEAEAITKQATTTSP